MLVSTPSVALATLSFAALTQGRAIANRVEERAALSSGIPVDFSFGVTVPTVSDPEAGTAPFMNFAGFHVPLPKDARSGKLVSFFGNFVNGTPVSTQLTAITDRQQKYVNTSSSSTSISGGPSMSNATILANDAAVVSTAFSSGNASSASAGSVPGGDSTSTSSSGNANSTATADGNGIVNIFTSAEAASASNAQSITNINDAAGATSCAASASGAQSEAEYTNYVIVPVGEPSQHLGFVNTAYAACAAGVDAPSETTGASSSGSQASIQGVSSDVTCNGVESTDQQSSTTFKVTVDGTYNVFTGFTGAVTGQRVARSESQC